eukprot:5217522-Prymnesium_polylepis.2
MLIAFMWLLSRFDAVRAFKPASIPQSEPAMQRRSSCSSSCCSGPGRALACGRASRPGSSNDKPMLRSRPPLTSSPPPRSPPSKEVRIRWAACRDERI